MISCASPSVQYIDHSLPSIKFCARIRDAIIKKLKQQYSRNRRQVESARNVKKEPVQVPHLAFGNTRFNQNSA